MKKNNSKSVIMENLEGRQLYSASAPQVVGYLPDYEYAQGGQQLIANLQANNFEGLTQINYFSVLPDANGVLPGTSVTISKGKTVANTGSLTSNGDASDPLTNIDAVVSAAHAAGVQVDIVVGGAGDDSTQLGKDIAAGSQVWKNFAASAAQFIKQHNLDGINIDWEAGYGEASQADITDYGNFLATLKKAVGGSQVSAAVDAEKLTLTDGSQAYALNAKAVQSVNTIDAMAYDLGNPADNAPIQQTETDLTNWASYIDSIPGASHSQLIFAMPFYGKATTIDPTIVNQWPLVSNDSSAVNVDAATYNDIVNAAPNAVDYSVNDVAQSVNNVSVAGTFNGNAPAETWNFDNRGAVYAKTQFALQQGYGGVAAWAIGQDYGALSTSGFDQSKSLLPAIRQAISDFNNPAPTTGTGTQPVTQATPSISGSVFNDANQNYTQDAGETGLAGFTVFIDVNHDGKLDAGDIVTTTDANGNFSFSNLAAGNYDVMVEAQSGYNATNWPDQLATVTTGQTAFVGFGEVAIQ